MTNKPENHPAWVAFEAVCKAFPDQAPAMLAWWDHWVLGASIEAATDPAMESRALVEAQRWQAATMTKELSKGLVERCVHTVEFPVKMGEKDLLGKRFTVLTLKAGA